MRKISYLLVVIILFSITAKAQRNLGIATSDWSGMNGLFLNPANIADTRERIVIDIVGINAGFDNNLGRINSIGSLFTSAKNGNTDNLFNYSNKNTFSLVAPFAEVRGPGFMININNRNSIALTTGVRGFNQFNNFDQSLFRTLSDPTYTYTGSSTGNIDLTSKNFNYTAQLWSQIGLSYAAVLVEEGEHTLKAGVTLRYLGGIGYVGLKGNNLDAHYRSGYDSLFVTNSDLQFGSNLLSTRNAIVDGFSNNNIFNQIFGKEQGHGMGGDIGLVYEYMPDPEMRKKHVDGDSRYKLRVSASITDIGSITYKSTNNFNANISGNGYITSGGLSGVGTFDEFRAYAKKQGFKADTVSVDTKLYMPTALVLGADYNIEKHFYVNAIFIGNIANRQNFGNSYYGTVTVTPRYDMKMFTVALPISYGMLAQNMKLGLGLRAYGFYVGSDDMLALVAKNQYGFNFYVGGFVPLYKHKGGHHWHPGADSSDMSPEPDMEHGGAIDTTDDCPDLIDATEYAPVSVGTISNQQGADTDGDGIPDSEDACPTEAGPASNHGCPLPKDAPKKTVNFSTTTIQIKKGTTIGKESYETLNQLATVLKEYPSYNIVINGYTDNTSTAAKNIALSTVRAESVKNYLAGKGIASGRMETKGMGDAQPVADNSTAEGRVKNRRVVITLKNK